MTATDELKEALMNAIIALSRAINMLNKLEEAANAGTEAGEKLRKTLWEISK